MGAHAAVTRVSVVMPVFNGERFVDEAIASVLAQEADELVIVDDGSTDRTRELLDAWTQRDARVRVIHSERNEGIAVALRKGIEASRGEYIALHDSDDVSLPGRFTRCAAALDADRDVALVAVWAELIDANGRKLYAVKRTSTPDVLAYLLHFSNVIGGSSRVMLRRRPLLAAGAGETQLSADYDLWTRVMQHGKVLVLPFTGIRYRIHDGGVTATKKDVQRRDAFAISKRMLSSLLERQVSGEEVAAVCGMRYREPLDGASPIAERIMREAFTRFHGDRAAVRHDHARQWARAAAVFAARRRFVEALRALVYGLRWNARALLSEALRVVAFKIG